MKYSISHVTEYRYAEPVALCHNRLCLTPRDTPYQRVLKSDLLLDPVPERIAKYSDADGNHRVFFSLDAPHDSMSVRAVSEVDRGVPRLPSPDDTPSWEIARPVGAPGGARRDPDVAPFVFASPFVPLHEGLAGYAADSFTPNRPLLAAVVELLDRMKQDFVYDATATEVTTHVMDAFRARRGVCQDFAHMLCGMLRSLGLAARYVSGYLETLPPPGGVKLLGADASHAWVSVWCPGVGWVDADPTNNLFPTDAHITIGWGRDYGDVCPVQGVVRGGGRHTLSVAVDVMPAGE